MTSPAKKGSEPTQPIGEAAFETGLNNILTSYRTRFGRELSQSETDRITSQARDYFNTEIQNLPEMAPMPAEGREDRIERENQDAEELELQQQWRAQQRRDKEKSTQIHYGLSLGGKVTREVVKVPKKTEGSSSKVQQEERKQDQKEVGRNRKNFGNFVKLN